ASGIHGMRLTICSVLMIFQVLPEVTSQFSFVEEDRSKAALIVLDTMEAFNDIACQEACVKNNLCQAISYASSKCVLLGEEHPDKLCSEVVTVSAKRPTPSTATTTTLATTTSTSVAP
ncbi:hypothetical protein PMAYCL1PPCAC_09011, partial [Pristionchus mayeri]